VFDKGAQINVAGLTASTLGFAPVPNSQDPDALFENGILSGSAPGQPPKAAFVGPSQGTAGDITVNAGASLTAADGGRILLLGSAVTNNGSISTPDGQTILGAATNAVYLAASSNPSMRGLLIEVDGGGTTGTVTNAGEISAARGNITLAGLMVNQQGTLSATTSVSANGSIYLVAGDTSAGSNFYNPNPTDPTNQQTAFGGLLPNNGGTLVLAPGSVTEVLPDTGDTTTLTAAQRAGFFASQVDLAGRVVAMEGNASIRAPGGTVELLAAANPANPNPGGTGPAGDGSSIYLDTNSTIDVSGLQAVSVPVTQNLVQVTLETNDLQNDPLQRNGFLHGTTVTVDIRNPPTLFDVTPYANNIGSSIEQILTTAGRIDLISSGEVISRAGSNLNVSGGSVAYQGGYGPSTTNLIGANGKVYNISTAPNNIPYVGVANNYNYTDPTWGVTTQGGGRSYYAGYTQGSGAGTIDIQSPQVYLRGSMQAATVDGPNQLTPASLARGGTFILGCGTCVNSEGVPSYGVNGGILFTSSVLPDNLIANVVIDGNPVGSVSLPATTTLSSTQLTQNGFNNIEVASNGAVTVPAGVSISLAPDGTFAARSTLGIDFSGLINAPGGSVLLQTANTQDFQSHDINLGAGSVIDAGGNWINDSPAVTLSPGTTPIVINGGSVNISAAGNLTVGAGSLIDVSGGGWINSSGQLTAGGAGSISLSAIFSLDPHQPSLDPFLGTLSLGPNVTLLGASLKSGEGGTISLESGSVTVGAAPAGTPGELVLPANFFAQGGFGQFNVTAETGLVIGNLQDAADSSPVLISPIEQTRVFTQNSLLIPTGASLASFTQLETLPASLRAPASVSFAAVASDASGAEVGDVTLARDATIVTDPQASVTLAANGYNGNLFVLGSIIAPAGTITLQLDNPLNAPQSSGDPGFIQGQRIELGPDVVLAAPAYAKIDTLDPQGYREGSVLNGGTISLLANKGFVQTDPGSLIEASGTVGTLDLPGAHGVIPTTVVGSAGTITIAAREGIVLQGDLLAPAATLNGAPVPGAAGGTLNIELGPNFNAAGLGGIASQDLNGAPGYPFTARTLTLVGVTAGGQAAVPPSNQLLSGTADINVATIERGGFDQIALTSADTLTFAGNVTLQANASLTLDAPLIEASSGAQVRLSAPYVAIGNYLNNPDYYDSQFPGANAAAVLNPAPGNATLAITGQLIDIRGVSGWSGFSTETLSSSGDIRFIAGENPFNTPPAVNVPGSPIFEGALETSASLNLQGAQLYPTTATGFAINDLPSTAPSLSAPTTVTIGSSLASGATPATPLSAGGSLSINATEIDQNGIVRAPAGQIALNGVSFVNSQGVTVPGTVNLSAGSLTSVSANGLLIPYGSTQNGTQWTYSPSASLTEIVTQPPAKQVSLTGDSVNINRGATLDLSGGGDLYAYEFVAGQGGSVDVLSPANLPAANHPAGTTVYTYAILPSLGSQFAPFDPQYASGSPASIGQTITLSGVPGLPAGTYALLPAYYALLPGAYAVQVVQPNSNILQGSAVAESNGAYEVAARFGVAGTTDLSSITSTVLVASDSIVRTQSQYTDSYANAFFTAAAQSSASAPPRLPADAGQLVLSANSALTLNGTIGFGAGSFVSGTTSAGTPITQQGLGGDVAITAQNIVVTDSNASQAPAGTLQLNVQQLDNLNAQTLILGAVGTATPAGEQLNVGVTQTVELKNTSALTAPQIILAAQDSVTVDANAQISAQGGSGTSSQAPETLVLPGGGALLRVASGPGAALSVDPTTLPATPTGVVSIGAGANVAAAGSLLLYGSENTLLAPSAQVSAPAVALYSSVVSLGAAPAGTSGLVVNSQLLGSLKNLTDLTLGSTSTINFYGGVQLGTPGSATPNLQSISLDAAGLGGYGAGDTVLQAGSINLTNSSGAAANFASTPNGTGKLSLIATGTGSSGSAGFTLGAGSKTVAGFSAVDLDSASDIVGQGTGSLIVASSSAAVPLNLTSAALLGGAGSDQTFSTSGAVTINGAANASSLVPAAGLGAKLTIEGSSIAQNGTIYMPAGIISLSASSGDVTLGNGSLTSAAGAVQAFSTANAVAPGGQISLSAQTGNVAINAGATVDVSGAQAGTGSTAQAGDAGVLSISAPLGTFTFAGAVIKGGAPAGQTSGSFTLDVGSGLAGGGLTALDTMLAQSGFSGAIDLRTRSDAAVTISTSVQAASFELAVDKGTIDVAGTGVIDTSGGTPLDGNGGSIALWAGNGLTLEPGAQLLANAGAAGPVGANGSSLPTHGGDITLGTASGNIAIASTSQNPVIISMQGSGGADTDGTLTLRAPRTTDNTGVQIQVQNGASIDLLSRNAVIIEGFKVYSATDLGSSDTGCGTGGSCDVADLNGMLFTDAATFEGNAAAIAASVGFANVEVRPGIEVDSTGDLVIGNGTKAWDLASWNAALGAPVNLTLRAGGNLIFNASLSDGFTNNGKAVNTWRFGEPGAAIDSASYRLTAGADLAAADPLAVIAQAAPATSLGAPPNSGNVIVTPGNLIRTGTGSIDIAAGGDLLLGYRVGDSSGNLYDNGTLQVTESDPLTSAIYTAGVPSILTPAQATLFAPSTLPVKLTQAGDSVSYPTQGGNISISVADDIRSAPSAQLITDWLWRRGSSLGSSTPTQSTSWWISFNQFQQGIGVLGGGDLSLSAGRDIVNAGAVIPTTGRLLVAAGTVPVAGDLLLTGGGNLNVRAGGDVLSGVFEDDWGNASIAAGGALTSSADSTFGQETAAINTSIAITPLPQSGTQIYPILAAGNGVFDVAARTGIALGGVTNSTTLPLTVANHGIVGSFAGDAAFFPYASAANPSTLNVSSTSGDVELNTESLSNIPIVALSAEKLVYETAPDPNTYLSTYPPTVNVTSLSGNIDLGDAKLAQVSPNGVQITLFPAAAGNLTLLAEGSINNDGQPYTINVSEADPAATPSALSPQDEVSFTGLAGLSVPQQPLHQDDTQPILLIANTGNLGTGSLVFPKAATVIAGGSITDLNYSGKNLNPGDVTLIAAGGSINYSTPTQPLTNDFLSNNNGIVLAGPGYLEVLAGGSINLGDSNGIVTSANLSDPRLPSTGASIVAGAGFGKNADGTFRQPAYQAFIDAYLAPTNGANSAYASTLVDYMQQIAPASAAPSYSAALAQFELLPSAQQLPLIARVLSDELSATGLAHTQQGASYARGYTAIDTLFPLTDSNGNPLTYSGDLNLVFSQLKTQEGGDIDLLVPGGSVNVGVANPPASLAFVKQTTTATGLTVPADVDLGILVLGEGAVQGFADQNFSVNSSRILTLEGGNIILWASNGNIDAGKGAKSASGAPPPVIQTDANGNLFVDPSNAVSGSGIGQLLTKPGIVPGLVNLIAPKGAVNAGDAGIRVAGNLNIAAVQVIGAGNITVAGTSTGVPTSEAGAFAGALSGANSLGDASKSALQQLSQDLGSAQNYQQLTDNLAPTFISVKMFCLGVQCETN
jgi:filamentous hemagglutinin